METRGYIVDIDALYTALGKITNSDFINTNLDYSINAAALTFFKAFGVDLAAPGRNVDYNPHKTMLFIRATPSELDFIEKIVAALNKTSPQIHIKARFMHVSNDEIGLILQNGIAVGKKETNQVEIINANKMALVLHELEFPKTELLGEPEAVTTSSRQVLMRTGNLTADLIPVLRPNGYTLSLVVIATDSETMIATANIWDGQTLALISSNSNDKSRLVVFVTASVVDPAGNRVHTDEDINLLQQKMKSDIPVQPQSLFTR
jgi:hypothetical protein